MKTKPRTPGKSNPGMANDSHWMKSVLQSPLLWGGALTFGFYQLIPVLPVQRELAERYFCSHPLEYATAALFFVGMALLGLKGIAVLRERSTDTERVLDDPDYFDSRDAVERATQIGQRLEMLSTKVGRTQIAGRVRDVCAYVRGRQSSEGLEEHLKYLAELASERLGQSFALVRTITWAVPIIGFLGTVIGITIAIANVTPEQLESSLVDVTGGLAVAFDTTALALALSLVLVFASYLIERSEQQILSDVEEFGIKRITPLFPDEPTASGALASVEAEAAQQLLDKTQSLIEWQTQLWQESIESIRGRWNESLEQQKHEFDDAIRQGMQMTLIDHSHQLSEMRGEFLQAFREAASELSGGLSAGFEVQQGLQESLSDQLEQLWQKIHTDIAQRGDDAKTMTEGLLESVSQRVDGWQSQLQQATEAGSGQLEELRQQREMLLEMGRQEDQLVRLQARLSENLEAVRSAETFEQTVHTLNAAVHLLTVRMNPKAA